jgi:hypothetical protein
MELPDESAAESAKTAPCVISLVSRAYSVDDRMINEYGVDGGKRTGRGNKSTREKTCPSVILSTTDPK